jgi:hypothetical protein
MDPVQSYYVGGEHYWRELDFLRGNGPEGPHFGLVATPNWLVRREVLDRVGTFDEDIRSWDDWELGLRIHLATRRVHVDAPLYLQDHLVYSGLMSMEAARAKDLRVIMRKHGDVWRDDARVQAQHWYFIGRVESRNLPRPAGRDALWLAARLAPWRPKVWLALALSYAGASVDAWVTRTVRGARALLRGSS